MKKGILFESILAIAIVLLVFVLYAMVSSSTPAAAVKWTTPTYDQARYMYAGDNGILYSFTGNSIYAVGSDGSRLWNVTIPDNWRISNEWMRLKQSDSGLSTELENSPVAASDEGVLYVYARPNLTSVQSISTIESFISIFAISSDGTIQWSVPLKSQLSIYGDASLDDAAIYAQGGRVYVFHDYNETVIDRNGTVLYTISDLSDPPAVDEQGFVYGVTPIKVDSTLNLGTDGTYDYRIPSSVVNAYYPNGTLYWSQDINELIQRQYLREDIKPQYDMLPIYRDDYLYLPLQSGMLALHRDGTVGWVKRLSEDKLSLLEVMPFDSDNNIYLKYANQANLSASYVYVLSGNGSYVSAPQPYDEYHSWNYMSGSNGIVYYVSIDSPKENSINDLDSLTLTAYDLRNGTDLWTYPIPALQKTTITLTASNVKTVFDPDTAADFTASDGQWQDQHGTGVAKKVYNRHDVSVLPGSDRVYVSVYNFNYEYPIIFGESKSSYVMGIYALDMNGRPVWQQSTDSYVTAMADRNGTLFYSTQDGKISAAKIDLATGIALAAAVYLFFRFFLLGAVSRARARIDKNENRNEVLKYIYAHPGSTLYEIARGIEMNLGTARYHVLILGVNHRIVAQRADNKYVRFFPNSNSFSQDEQVILSFIRREPTRKVLGLLLEKPGLTNVDLSRELDIAESTISKYIKELTAKDILDKDPLPGGRFAYSIKQQYKERVAVALESMKCVQ
jgi:predicted transcriptional regulator